MSADVLQAIAGLVTALGVAAAGVYVARARAARIAAQRVDQAAGDLRANELHRLVQRLTDLEAEIPRLWRAIRKLRGERDP